MNENVQIEQPKVKAPRTEENHHQPFFGIKKYWKDIKEMNKSELAGEQRVKGIFSH